jgi:hypothetical protein
MLTKQQIKDKNCLLEIYLTALFRNKNTQVERMGNLKEDSDLGIYCVWFKDTCKYCIILTDTEYYFEDEDQDIREREKKSTIFLYPENEKYKFISLQAQEEVNLFFNGGHTDLDFYDTTDFLFIKKYLENA